MMAKQMVRNLFVLRRIACVLILLPFAASCAQQAESTSVVRVTPVAVAIEEECLELEWDQLNFAIDRNQKFELAQLPQRIRDLNGKRVRIRGYVLPTFAQKNIREFVIAGEIKNETDAGVNRRNPFLPAAHQLAMVKMNAAPLASFPLQPICLEGRLSLEIQEIDGEVVSVFNIAADKAQVVQPRTGFHSASEHGC